MQYQTVDVTQGSNGYPKNIYKAIVADTILELEEIEKECPCFRVMLRQRDGWQLWEKRSQWTEPNLLNIGAKDSDTVIRYRPGHDSPAELAAQIIIGVNTTYPETLFEQHPSASIEEAIEILQKWRQRSTEIEEEINEDIPCDIWMNNPDPTHVSFTVDDQSTSYREDVWSYQLALIPCNPEDIDQLS